MTQLRVFSGSRTRWIAPSVGALASLAVACGGGEMPTDGGTQNDAFDPADARAIDAGAGGLGTCTAPRTVSLTLGETAMVTGDTSDGPEGPLTLSDPCANPDATARPPQEVIAVEVPGTGDIGVAFDLTEGTAATFDTVVELRTACETTPTGLDNCFDDPSQDEHRSAGTFMTTGGSTIYLVVSGFEMGAMGTVSSGAYTMRLSAEANTAPTLTAASARRVDDDRLEIFATGMDAETNVEGVGLQLLAADGTALPLDAAVPDDVGPYYYAFDTAVTTASFAMQLATAPGSADFDGIGAAVSLRLFSYDAYGARSATRDVTIDMVTEVGFGGSCDATHLCRAPNLCEAGTCIASPETIALCGMAAPVTLTAPTGSEPTVSTQSVMLAAGGGAASGVTCDYAALASEKVLALTVPAGSFDLIATTNVAANPAALDTILYVRSECVNDTTELVCDDDYAGAPDGDYRSYALVENVPAGTQYLFVDGYAPFDATTTVALELRLRPVLATGAACDPMGIANRCAAAACPATGAAVCP
ncbi:MAG: hypothetical protein K1X94_27955 [Sandaracinaceae bacterium]|nr:hypothetical protein [Sandaracinaceae bacterium]